jgi:hypothetical protein
VRPPSPTPRVRSRVARSILLLSTHASSCPARLPVPIQSSPDHPISSNPKPTRDPNLPPPPPIPCRRRPRSPPDVDTDAASPDVAIGSCTPTQPRRHPPPTRPTPSSPCRLPESPSSLPSGPSPLSTPSRRSTPASTMAGRSPLGFEAPTPTYAPSSYYSSTVGHDFFLPASASPNLDD